MTSPIRAARLAWVAGAVALALLAWQGHHLSHWLPQFERTIEGLGSWGPVVFVAAILLFGPLFVPDSVFGIAAGATFGLVPGTAYFFAAVYIMCLVGWVAPGPARSVRPRESTTPPRGRDTRIGTRVEIAITPAIT